MFGLMGLVQSLLDIGSSLLCGIAFGGGIDYSIHIIEADLRNLKREQYRGKARYIDTPGDLSKPCKRSKKHPLLKELMFFDIA